MFKSILLAAALVVIGSQAFAETDYSNCPYFHKDGQPNLASADLTHGALTPNNVAQLDQLLVKKNKTPVISNNGLLSN